MKAFKIVLLCFCMFSLLLPLIVGIVSSGMQSHYKSQMDDLSNSTQETQELLAKKSFWANVGETTALKYSYVVFAFLAVFLFVLKILKL